MADLSSFTHKWRATTNSDHRFDANKVAKRNRQPVSCLPCRTRKLKCDRGHPCDACTKRGDDDSCVYGKATNGSATNSSNHNRDDTRAPNTKAHDKLRHLEELVKRMVDAGQRPGIDTALTPPEDHSSASPREGLLNREGGTSSYAGSTHWSAVLEHIHELKNDLDVSNDDTPSPFASIDYNTPDSLFGAPRPPSLQWILQNHLAPRVQIDRRVSQYFNAKYMIIPFVHVKHFQRQYEAFWKDPLNTSPIWVSIMFSICSLAASLSAVSSSSPGNNDASTARDSFEAAAAHCLVLGNFSKPQPHVIEALSLFLQCKYARQLDPSREVAMMFSVQCRLAFMMGYHRDGSNYPNTFSPFEAEIRRRAWAMTKQFDVMVSFQLGIPNCVPPGSWDTLNPSNLLDTDFDEDTVVMPPTRPETEVTQSLYFSVKSRLIDSFAVVCQHAINFRSDTPSSAEIMSLDAQVRTTQKTIPEVLRIKPISQSVTDPAYLVMTRLNVSFLWRKAVCVLHRKYMASTGHEQSYQLAVEAASDMASSLLDLYPEFQPGGLFENDGWMLSSFTIIDFLLAIMILSLALSISRKRHIAKGGTRAQWLEVEDTKRIMTMLDKSVEICTELGPRSKEAKCVSQLLLTALAQFRKTEHWSSVDRRSAKDTHSTVLGTPDCKEDEPPNLTPLSLREGPTSVVPGAGSFPPENYYPTETLGSLLTPGQPQTPGIGPNIASPNGVTTHTSYPNTAFTTMSSPNDETKTKWPWPNGFDFEPFANIMEGVEGPSQIDWTQFDQFTSGFGLDYADGMGLNTGLTPGPNTSGDDGSVDYGDWNSTPHRFLGGVSRDPVTGISQKP